MSDKRGSWKPILNTDGATQAVAIARQVATRSQDPARVEIAVAYAKRQTGYPKSIHWHPISVAQGYAGLGLLWGYMDTCFPGEGWDLVGRAHLEIAARAAERQSSFTYGMYAGLGGLALTSWYLSRNGKRYRKLRSSIEGPLLQLIAGATGSAAAARHGVGVSSFDVISGLSGVGRYLLLRIDDSRHEAILKAVLRCLARLTKKKGGLPHWYTPPQLISDEISLRLYPYGNLNCGLAHGIPGPLAMLSIAAMAGVVIEGQFEAIRDIAEWLCQCRVYDRWGLNWPTAVPVGPEGVPLNPPSNADSQEVGRGSYRPSRAAWCYGSPGIARSLWLAGKAVREPRYQDIAVAAMDAVYRRPLEARHIDSPTFCHGVAGLQQITLRFAHDTKLPLFIDAARTLHRQIMGAYEPASVLGYRNVEPGGCRIDHPGLLDGAPGVALVLLAAATSVEPVWDRLFLLS
jgi:hypothetical protein